MLEMEKVKEDVAEFTESLFGDVLYLVHVHQMDGDDDFFYPFKSFKSAEEKFYAEVGRALVDTNVDNEGKCGTVLNFEFVDVGRKNPFGKIHYFASHGYSTEVSMYRMKIME